jgi:outer membrane protein assembly factor BamE
MMAAIIVRPTNLLQQKPSMPSQQLSRTRTRPANLVLALGAVLLLGLGGAGCVFRPDIKQGNFLEAKDVDQVTVGMTRSQVRYVLGTPLVEAPFDNARWDYVFYRQKGRLANAERRHFVVYFENDKVVRVDRPTSPAS